MTLPALAADRRWPDARLGTAVALAEAVAAGETDLHVLNQQSLEWRGKL